MSKNVDLEKLAFIDPITGLLNYQALLRDYDEKALDNIHFIFVDIDDSGTMDVIFGSDAVDGILDEVGKTLIDYCGKSKVYKVGPDQFLLVTESHIHCKPSELKKILRQPVKRNGSTYQVKASICVLDYDDFIGDSFDAIFHMMRFAVNVEKRKGKSRLIFADQKLKMIFNEKIEIGQNIFNAVRKRDFFPKFQPFVDTFTNEMVGFETVSRWNLNGRIVKPEKYLEIAEWTTLIYAIEMQMFKETISFFNELKGNRNIKLSKRFKASINFSAYTLKHVKTKKLTDLVEKSGCHPHDFIIEIKESFITNADAYTKVKELHDLGFLIALDEYTNTSSSLTYLADLKVNILKLAECLLNKTDDPTEYNKMHSVYQFMSEIGQKLDLTIVSQGITNIEHVKLAKSLNINIGSGKFFSRAVEKHDFIDLFSTINKKRR